MWQNELTSNYDLEYLASKLNLKNFQVLNKEFSEKLLTKKHFNYVLNLDSEDGGGTHWVSLRRRNNDIYYQDSYGFEPPQQLRDQLDKINAEKTYLSHQIQPDESKRCGFYALLALKNEPEHIYEFQIGNHPENDNILKNMLTETNGGFLDWAINNLPGELHLISNPTGKRSWNLKKMSFAGPGTFLTPQDQRLKGKEHKARTSGAPDYKIKPWSKPINTLDKAAYFHDIAYDKFKTRGKRKAADLRLASESKKVASDSSETYVNRGVAAIVSKVMQKMGS